ncbi:MAG: HNH endonuclease [Acidobacteria bacterium]|nr:HNH endonuclease [Acidobacteriota bacterium]
MTGEQRARALIALSRYFGTDQTAAFFRDTRAQCPQAGIDHIHSLVQGIYKPANSPYVFSIWSQSAAGAAREIYPDTFTLLDDGRWSMRYAPMRGPLDRGVNAALFACRRDGVPILAVVTTAPKSAPGGARYRLLGLARITDYDGTFVLEGNSAIVAEGLRTPTAQDDELEEVDIRGGLVVPFRRSEPRQRCVVSRDARDRAFRRIVLEEYGNLCAVCRSMFVLREDAQLYIEAEAAHIIPVLDRGPDDPRNGLSLCRRHHWALDQGFFGVTDSYEVRVSASVTRATRQRFDLEEYDREPIVAPAHDACRPSPEALDWHRRRKFKAG